MQSVFLLLLLLWRDSHRERISANLRKKQKKKNNAISPNFIYSICFYRVDISNFQKWQWQLTNNLVTIINWNENNTTIVMDTIKNNNNTSGSNKFHQFLNVHHLDDRLMIEIIKLFTFISIQPNHGPNDERTS